MPVQLREHDQPDPRVRAIVLFVLLLLFLALPCSLPWLIWGDHTYVQRFEIPGGSIEIDSGDGDPIFGFSVDVKLKDGKERKGLLGYSGDRLRHKLVSSAASPVIGVVEKDRSHQVVMLVHTATGEFWALDVLNRDGWEDLETGRKLLDQLRVATGQNLELATEDL